MSPKLTIDLGLRHEYYTPFIGLADAGGLSNYDPATNTLQVAGYGDVGQSVGVKKYLKNFGPARRRLLPAGRQTVLRGGYGVSTLPFPDNAYVYNYPVKQNNVFNAPNNFAPAPRSMSTGFPDPVFVQIPSNGIIDASTPALRNAAYFHVSRPTRTKDRSIRSTSRSSASCPAASRSTSPTSATAAATCRHATTRTPRPSSGAGQRRPAALPSVRQIGGRRDLDRDQDGVQLAPGEAGSPIRPRPRVTTSYTLGRGKNYSDGDCNGNIQTPADSSAAGRRRGEDRLHDFIGRPSTTSPSARFRGTPWHGARRGWQISGLRSRSQARRSISRPTTRRCGLQATVSGRTPAGARACSAVWDPVSCGSTPRYSRPRRRYLGQCRKERPARWPGRPDGRCRAGQGPADFARRAWRVSHRSFNVANRPQWNNPDGTLGNATFGQIVSVVPFSERVVRFGLRLSF